MPEVKVADPEPRTRTVTRTASIDVGWEPIAVCTPNPPTTSGDPFEAVS